MYPPSQWAPTPAVPTAPTHPSALQQARTPAAGHAVMYPPSQWAPTHPLAPAAGHAVMYPPSQWASPPAVPTAPPHPSALYQAPTPAGIPPPSLQAGSEPSPSDAPVSNAERLALSLWGSAPSPTSHASSRSLTASHPAGTCGLEQNPTPARSLSHAPHPPSGHSEPRSVVAATSASPPVGTKACPPKEPTVAFTAAAPPAAVALNPAVPNRALQGLDSGAFPEMGSLVGQVGQSSLLEDLTADLQGSAASSAGMSTSQPGHDGLDQSRLLISRHRAPSVSHYALGDPQPLHANDKVGTQESVVPASTSRCVPGSPTKQQRCDPPSSPAPPYPLHGSQDAHAETGARRPRMRTSSLQRKPLASRLSHTHAVHASTPQVDQAQSFAQGDDQLGSAQLHSSPVPPAHHVQKLAAAARDDARHASDTDLSSFNSTPLESASTTGQLNDPLHRVHDDEPHQMSAEQILPGVAPQQEMLVSHAEAVQGAAPAPTAPPFDADHVAESIAAAEASAGRFIQGLSMQCKPQQADSGRVQDADAHLMQASQSPAPLTLQQPTIQESDMSSGAALRQKESTSSGVALEAVHQEQQQQQQTGGEAQAFDPSIGEMHTVEPARPSGYVVQGALESIEDPVQLSCDGLCRPHSGQQQQPPATIQRPHSSQQPHSNAAALIASQEIFLAGRMAPRLHKIPTPSPQQQQGCKGPSVLSETQLTAASKTVSMSHLTEAPLHAPEQRCEMHAPGAMISTTNSQEPKQLRSDVEHAKNCVSPSESEQVSSSAPPLAGGSCVKASPELSALIAYASSDESENEEADQIEQAAGNPGGMDAVHQQSSDESLQLDSTAAVDSTPQDATPEPSASPAHERPPSQQSDGIVRPAVSRLDVHKESHDVRESATDVDGDYDQPASLQSLGPVQSCGHIIGGCDVHEGSHETIEATHIDEAAGRPANLQSCNSARPNGHDSGALAQDLLVCSSPPLPAPHEVPETAPHAEPQPRACTSSPPADAAQAFPPPVGSAGVTQLPGSFVAASLKPDVSFKASEAKVLPLSSQPAICKPRLDVDDRARAARKRERDEAHAAYNKKYKLGAYAEPRRLVPLSPPRRASRHAHQAGSKPRKPSCGSFREQNDHAARASRELLPRSQSRHDDRHVPRSERPLSRPRSSCRSRSPGSRSRGSKVDALDRQKPRQKLHAEPREPDDRSVYGRQHRGEGHVRASAEKLGSRHQHGDMHDEARPNHQQSAAMDKAPTADPLYAAAGTASIQPPAREAQNSQASGGARSKQGRSVRPEAAAAADHAAAGPHDRSRSPQPGITSGPVSKTQKSALQTTVRRRSRSPSQDHGKWGRSADVHASGKLPENSGPPAAAQDRESKPGRPKDRAKSGLIMAEEYMATVAAREGAAAGVACPLSDPSREAGARSTTNVDASPAAALADSVTSMPAPLPSAAVDREMRRALERQFACPARPRGDRRGSKQPAQALHAALPGFAPVLEQQEVGTDMQVALECVAKVMFTHAQPASTSAAAMPTLPVDLAKMPDRTPTHAGQHAADSTHAGSDASAEDASAANQASTPSGTRADACSALAGNGHVAHELSASKGTQEDPCRTPLPPSSSGVQPKMTCRHTPRGSPGSRKLLGAADNAPVTQENGFVVRGSFGKSPGAEHIAFRNRAHTKRTTSPPENPSLPLTPAPTPGLGVQSTPVHLHLSTLPPKGMQSDDGQQASRQAVRPRQSKKMRVSPVGLADQYAELDDLCSQPNDAQLKGSGSAAMLPQCTPGKAPAGHTESDSRNGKRLKPAPSQHQTVLPSRGSRQSLDGDQAGRHDHRCKTPELQNGHWREERKSSKHQERATHDVGRSKAPKRRDLQPGEASERGTRGAETLGEQELGRERNNGKQHVGSGDKPKYKRERSAQDMILKDGSLVPSPQHRSVLFPWMRSPPPPPPPPPLLPQRVSLHVDSIRAEWPCSCYLPGWSCQLQGDCWEQIALSLCGILLAAFTGMRP